MVYKRRTAMPLAQARSYLTHGVRPCANDQVGREIDWFLQFYRPRPVVFIAYDREALTCPGDPDFRLTFDAGLRCRNGNLGITCGRMPMNKDAL